MTFLARTLGSAASGYAGSLTAGYSSFTQFVGFFSGSLGSLSPGTFRGITINALYDHIGSTATFQIAQAGLSQSYFNQLTLAGLGTKTAASASSFTNTGGASTWVWATTFGMTNGGVYSVTIS